MTAHDAAGDARLITPPSVHGDAQYSAAVQHNSMQSPVPNPTPKSVAFELLVPERPQYRARLPMRVQIYPHDTTDSIITTVKNFYGLYNGSGGPTGIIFEDERGNTLIARYENLRDNMNVYVRVIEASPPHVSPTYGPMSYHSVSPTTGEQGHYNGNSHHMPPPQPAQALSYGQPAPRPDSRASRKRSVSPNSGRGRRSASASANPPNKKARSQSGYKSRNSSAHGSFADIYSDGVNGYSSGDGAPCSVSSKTKSEHLGNTEISLDNIVEGGRRKRAKFESSELPLFAPPQMPAATSNSSVSPARRMENQRASLPFTRPAHHAFAHPQVLQSPQSYNGGFAQPGMYTTPNNDGRRTRGGPTYPPSRGSTNITPNGNSSGILPTPDPTIGSCMSEEDKDVALQLMRLGDMSNNSHGRTSASTLDDTFSGHADAASSTGATSESESESENELPPARRQKLEHSPILPPGAVKRFGKHMDDNLPSQDSEMSEDYDDGRDATFKPEVYDDIPNNFSLAFGDKARARSQGPSKPRAKSAKPSKTTQRPGGANATKVKVAKAASVVGRQPMSPASTAAHSRKTSVTSAINFQHQLGEDEEDLSSKPRCQRCRKSKKGCDRQRPCQRCKDAGLSADQCISEDEGNGRKGRYGRHMGVKVKKDEMEAAAANGGYPLEMAMNTVGGVDKNKKRKR
ncbi:hypothetical protein VE01_09767 [Pseudogymnoascus verrucosus]|uniref:Zn(2)-C6 fungal-type domain-containing protein n=1 Tax=Pseudogymnoascus verrucosus TaxID=342668 RepID=A0A1B8G8D3_9PEZI|nr:uncharacterized protein VE01_09767 [Pseudogymnoascus verrucosus]OBT92088.1 hypothetical protein VE01_09767 [Pseudogymnoascus verrucosus]